MIYTIAFVVPLLSLLSFTSAAAINARQDDCTFACPDIDLDGNPLLAFAPGVTTITCTYAGDSCTYDSTTGELAGDGSCPAEAVQQCFARRRRELKQAVAKRRLGVDHVDKRDTAPSPVQWGRRGSPSSSPIYEVPYPTRVKRSDSTVHTPPPSSTPSPPPPSTPSPPPSSTPSPYDSGPTPPPYKPSPSPCKPSPSPCKPTPSPDQPTPSPWKSDSPQNQSSCDFRCPQQDLANNPLTDVAIRDSYLFCSFSASTPHCKTCSFCKYSTETGLLLEDNDDGNCPQKASATRPWDRRYV